MSQISSLNYLSSSGDEEEDSIVLKKKRGRPTKTPAKTAAATSAATHKRTMLSRAQACLEHLKTHNGECLQRDTVRILLTHMIHIFLEAAREGVGAGVSLDDFSVYSCVIEPTAKTHHLSTRTAQKLWAGIVSYMRGLDGTDVGVTEAGVTGLLDDLTQTAKRGRHQCPYRTELVSPEHVSLLHAFIHDRMQNGQTVHNKNIRHFLLTCPNPINVSRNVVRRLLPAIGYEYCKRKPQRISEERAAAQQQRIAKFLLEYRSALNRPDTVLVYMDESYLHHHHAFDAGYYPVSKDERLARTSGRGRRLIIVHAITKDGPLHVNNDLTCEWIFHSQPGLADYHKNMNSDNFMNWVTTKLLPTFQHRYPGKRMALVLDNAPYHHARDETYVDVSALNKSQALSKMIELEMQSLTVTRTNTTVGPGGSHTHTVTTTFPLNSWPDGKVPKFPKGPSLDEMRACLLAHIQEHFAHLLRTRLTKLFDEKCYSLIFTPPYCPQFQPIELFWAHGKNYVADCFANGRSMAQAQEQLQAAFRGTHSPAMKKPVNCASLIQHCEDEMISWASQSGLFVTPVESLSSLALAEEAVDEVSPGGVGGFIEVEEDGVNESESDDDIND
eukprot:m.137437 g.137437  ORF g.137437 m.137437 type:complete len:612 (+) comp14898_c0_seq4:228-2063(+)